jgi:hypothetical protein
VSQYKLETSNAYNAVVFQALSSASDIVANDFSQFVFDAVQSGELKLFSYSAFHMLF